MLFKKKIQDETLEEQLNELPLLPEQIRTNIVSGENCDQVTGVSGEFGRTETNPIPVNFSKGEAKYLSRLRCKCGTGLFFHRLGSLEVQNVKNPVDAYETVCIKGLHWDVLYFDMYHPRRSTKLPRGYSYRKPENAVQKIGFGFGTNKYSEKFPYGLSEYITRHYGEFGGSMARAYERMIAESNSEFIRPETQNDKLHHFFEIQKDIPIIKMELKDKDGKTFLLGVEKSSDKVLYKKLLIKSENRDITVEKLLLKWRKMMPFQLVFLLITLAVIYYPFIRLNTIISGIIFILALFIIGYANLNRDRINTYDIPYNVAEVFRKKSGYVKVVVFGYGLLALSVFIASRSIKLNILLLIWELVVFYIISSITLPLLLDTLEKIIAEKISRR